MRFTVWKALAGARAAAVFPIAPSNSTSQSGYGKIVSQSLFNTKLFCLRLLLMAENRIILLWCHCHVCRSNVQVVTKTAISGTASAFQVKRRMSY